MQILLFKIGKIEKKNSLRGFLSQKNIKKKHFRYFPFKYYFRFDVKEWRISFFVESFLSKSD